MERVSGWYRRRVQVVMWIVAIVAVLALNADTIRITQQLWSDKAVRAAVVARAGGAAQQPLSTPQGGLGNIATTVDELQQLSIPMGWSIEQRPEGGGQWIVRILLKALGLLLTAAALSMGAPFWFDVLSKVARLRSAGAPPPATDALRHGEGEEARSA